MDELISRQDAIDAINHICPVDTEYDCALLDRVDVRYVLSNLPSIDAVPQWIPVTKRLPEEKGEYLVTYHPCYWDDVETDIRVGIDSFRGKTTWAKRKYQRVVAWMPLPKPYEAERKEEWMI